MPVISPIDLPDMQEPARTAMQGRPPAHLFRVIAHAPTMLPPFLLLGDALLHELALDTWLREVAILRVAAITRAGYVLHHHRMLVGTMDIPPAYIAAVVGEAPITTLPERERQIVAYVDALVEDVQAPLALTEAIAQALGERQMTELTLVIGFYQMVAAVVRNAPVAVEQPGALTRP